MELVDPFDLSDFNDTINETKWCDMEDVKKDSKKFSILFSLECLVGLASLIANLLFLVIIRRVKVMPVNVRYLLIHLSLNFLWYVAANIYKAFTFLITEDVCSLTMNAFECRLRELAFTLPLSATLYSILGICLERLCSTFYRRNRDHVTIPPIMAIVFVLIIWTATLSNMLQALPSIPRDRIVPVCEAFLSVGATGAKSSIAVNMVLEILAMCVMTAVTVYEKYVAKNIAINRVRYTLSSRFVITQNVEVNALMFPSMMLHVLCWLPNFAFYLLVIFGAPMNTSTKWMVIHLTYLWRLIYSLCHPILAFSRNFHVKRQLKKSGFYVCLISLWKKSTGKVGATYQNDRGIETNLKAHFEYLEHVWAITYRQKLSQDKKTAV